MIACIEPNNSGVLFCLVLLMTKYFAKTLVWYNYLRSYISQITLKSHYQICFVYFKPTWIHFEIIDSHCRCATIHQNHNYIDVSPFDSRDARSFQIYSSEKWFSHHQAHAHQAAFYMGDIHVLRFTHQYMNLVIYSPIWKRNRVKIIIGCILWYTYTTYIYMYIYIYIYI